MSRKQPCESCTLPKGSIWTVPTIRKQRRKRLLLSIQKATISARAIAASACVQTSLSRVVHLLPCVRECTRTNPKARSNLHTQDAHIFPRCYIGYMMLTVGASYLHCWSAFQRAAISKHRYGVIGLTWRSRSAAADGGKTVLITLPLKVSRCRLRLTLQTPHLGHHRRKTFQKHLSR